MLVVSGGFDVSWLRDQVREHYDAWKRQPEPDLEVPREPPQKEERRDCIIWKDDQVTPKMMVGYHGPEMSLDAPDYCVLDVISQLLFMRSQRLAKRLYTNLQLVESISGWITGSKDPNLFIIYASLKKGGTTAKVLEIVDEELEQLRGEKVSERELVKAKNALAASMLYSLDRPYAVARSLGFHQIAGGDYRLLMRIEARYQTITRADVQNVAQRIFRAANRTVVELLPKSSAQST